MNVLDLIETIEPNWRLSDRIPQSNTMTTRVYRYIRSQLDQDFESVVHKDDMLDRVNDAMWNISTEMARNNGLPVWRVIVASEDWNRRIRPGESLGIYWAYIRDKASAHWGKFHEDAILWRMNAKVLPQQVNWTITFAHNASFSYQDEAEIRLKKGTKIILTGLEIASDKIRKNWEPVPFNPGPYRA